MSRLFADGTVFTAFDTETTGLKPEYERLIEIGAIRFDKNGIIARYDILINPGKPIPPGASAINNITDDMVRNCPLIESVLPDFLTFVRDSVLVAHNAGFDLSFVNKELERSGFNPLKNNAADTVHLARSRFPQLPNHKLQSLAAYFGIDVRNAHRAEDDARVCMEVFLRCLNAG